MQRRSNFRGTGGCEAELLAIGFVLIDDEGQITIDPTLDVFPIFEYTKPYGIRCMKENITSKPKFFSELKKVAERNDLSIPTPFDSPHIFEFVTAPTDNTIILDAQFNEIRQIQIDLIEFLLINKKANPALDFICVSDWINDYSRRFPADAITAADGTDHMYILVDYSIEQLALTVSQQKHWREKNNLHLLAQEIQEQLLHSVQFNFVAALQHNMGSMLIENIVNPILSEFKDYHEALHKIITQGVAGLIAKGLTEAQAHAKIEATEKMILFLTSNQIIPETQIRILQQAEYNAKNACAFLLNIEKRKLAKLHGFFFILSMRILTETAFIPLPPYNTSKNKYFFFVKNLLPELTECLSSHDKKLLFSLNDEERDELLLQIAGSCEILGVQYRVNQNQFTVKELLKNVLGYSETICCDSLPGSPANEIEQLPIEPKTEKLRSKDHRLRWLLLECRVNPLKNLTDTKIKMIRILQLTNLFCQTTYLRTQQGSSTSSGVHETKQLDAAHEVDKNVANALRVIFDRVSLVFTAQRGNQEFEQLKNELREKIFSLERDIMLKQINFLFTQVETIPFPIIQEIVIDLFREKLFTSFTFPLQQHDKQYAAYILNRYALTKKIPDGVEFLDLVMSLDNPAETQRVIAAIGNEKFNKIIDSLSDNKSLQVHLKKFQPLPSALANSVFSQNNQVSPNQIETSMSCQRRLASSS